MSTAITFESISDDELFSMYSDVYKSYYNIRPSLSYVTREFIIDWFDYESQPEVVAARQKELEEEVKFFESMEKRYQEELEILAKEQKEQEEMYLESQERMYYEMEMALS